MPPATTAGVVRSASGVSLAAAFRRFRVGVIYWWRHGRWPNLDQPSRFTEWVQWRKLHDRSPVRARLTDKLHSKALAAERAGADIVVPTLWTGRALPSVPPGALPLVVKSNHGCNQVRIIRTRDDWDAARKVAPRWLAAPYGRWLDEWHYRAAERTLLVEPFIGPADGSLPLDYKVYVFGGRTEVVQLHVGRGARHRWTQFDRSWKALSDDPLPNGPPANLARMLGVAERLAAGHDFLRVDFYEVDGRLWFGEFCLFPGSGLDPFQPAALDSWLGACWSASRRSLSRAASSADQMALTTTEPSPTEEATRLTEPERTSPTAQMRGCEVAKGEGPPASRPVSTKPLESSATMFSSQPVLGAAPTMTNSAEQSSRRSPSGVRRVTA